MEIYTNTAHGTALLSHSPKAVEKSLKLKPNTHTSLGREIYFSVGKSQLLCCEQYCFGWYQPKCTKPPLVHPTTH